MVTLESLGITPAKAKQFAARGITNGEELVRYLPKKYSDYTQITGPKTELDVSVFIAHAKSSNLLQAASGNLYIKMLATCDGLDLEILWFNQTYLLSELQSYSGSDVLIIGKVTYNEYNGSYVVSSPKVCTPNIDSAQKIYSEYRKIPGMSAQYLEDHLKLALENPACTEETLPAEYRKGYMSIPAAINTLHFPKSMRELKKAQERIKYDDLLYFALRLELANRNQSTVSKYGISDTAYMDKMRAALPFQLTAGQDEAIQGMLAHIRSGQRLSALLCGDVGSGKTQVAFMIMAAIASSGLQAVIVAPTQQLASQHYADMVAQFEPLGISVAFYGDPSLSAADRNKQLQGLKDGTIQLAVGTHALFSPKVEFKNLAFVVIDEEHKFGVAQRETLTQKTSSGVHCLTMSATPIPRSLAQGLYGDAVQVFYIRTRPAGRKPNITLAYPTEITPLRYIPRENYIKKPVSIRTPMERICEFIRYTHSSGHQMYIVCPAIEKGSSDMMKDVITVEQCYKWLQGFEHEGIKTEIITGSAGKKNKSENDEIIQRFKANVTNILLATSVIEVGINVPNATGILIMSAERFGLASLHQLRGRVGRGSDQGYCVLYAKDAGNNMRVQALCRTNDGFEIAEADLAQRGPGDFLGTQQSGYEKYVMLMLSDPDMFQQAKKIARKLIDNNASCSLLDQAVTDFRAAEA